jgi:hypothetical protein
MKTAEGVDFVVTTGKAFVPAGIWLKPGSE